MKIFSVTTYFKFLENDFLETLEYKIKALNSDQAKIKAQIYEEIFELNHNERIKIIGSRILNKI